MKKKLILICDTKNEIDDQFAIAYALHSPEIELLGVVSTQNSRRSGIDSVDIYHEEAKKILELAGSSVPAFKGARHPFSGTPEKSEGVNFIIQTILSNPNERIIIGCTGPATDLVNVIKLEPKIADKADFIWLGGHRYWLRDAETNFRGDILAAKTLSSLTSNLTIIPVIGTSYVLFLNTSEIKEKLLKKNTPLSRYLAELVDWNNKRIKMWRLVNRWCFCDLSVVAVAINVGGLINEGQPKIALRLNRKEIINDFSKKILE